MKKTLTVNISGIVFHIDEDAYRVLNDYLESINSHFSRTKGGDEIASDIEARIAEMLRDRIGDDRQVITIDDIEEIIQVIGQPSEFGEEFSEDQQQGQQARSAQSTKRLYRDPEHSVLGGVCGGLGAYFHTDPVWFRVAFVLLSIIGIGTPLLVYVILWVVVPEAKTAAERLEMKGEKVNISNIESSIKEEINHLKTKINDFTEGARRTYKKKSAIHRSDMEGVGNALGRVAELFVKIVLVFTGVILFLFGLSFIVALLVLTFGFGHDIFIMESELIYVSFPSLVEFFIGSIGNSVIFQIAFLLLIGIPLFMLLYAGVKLIFGLGRTRFIGITAFNIWLAALIISGYYGYKVVRSFSHAGVHKEVAVAEVPADRTINLKLNENEKFKSSYRYREYFDIEEANMIITNDEDDFFYGIPSLEVERNATEEIEVVVYQRARGKSSVHAAERAERTMYNYAVEGSTLTFDNFFKLPEREVWREQQVDIVVRVPEGCKVHFDQNMQPILDDKRYSPYRLSGETWIMTGSGLEETGAELPDQPGEIEEEVTDTITQSITSIRYSDLIGIFLADLKRVIGFAA